MISLARLHRLLTLVPCHTNTHTHTHTNTHNVCVFVCVFVCVLVCVWCWCSHRFWPALGTEKRENSRSGVRRELWQSRLCASSKARSA